MSARSSFNTLRMSAPPASGRLKPPPPTCGSMRGMNEYLANALRSPAEAWVPDLFYEDFRTAAQWMAFIAKRFPNGVRSVLSKQHGWSVKDFQALYVACWIYKPVVKGSYLLLLFDQHEAGVEKAYRKKLSSRMTSHLHGPTTKGANASSG